MSVIIDEQQFLAGNNIGAFSLIRGYVDVYASLPTASDHDGEFWFVTTGSVPKIPLTKIYEYPAGLYVSAGSEWIIAPISTEFSENTTMRLNITDWNTFYQTVDYINIGTQLVYDGKTYSNLTGAISGNNPAIDTTNWLSKIIVENIENNTNDLTIKTADNYTLLLDKPVYEDLNFDPAASGGPAVSLPDYVTIDGVVYREFTNSNNQICGDGNEIPHEYKLGSDLKLHLHGFLRAGQSIGTTGVEFTMYWAIREQDGITYTNGSAVFTVTSANLNNVCVNFYSATGGAETISGANTLGAQIAVTLARTGGDAGDFIVTSYGIHYQIDTMGSRQVGSK